MGYLEMKTVHKLCTYLRQDDDEPVCKQCPAWEESRRGKVKRGCRFNAESVLNIVKTGNPWGKKNFKWP